MRTVDPSSWLVFPPAVDLANTVVPGVADLLADTGELARFVAIERDRIPGIEHLHDGPAELRRVRETVRPLLAATTAGAPLPAQAVDRVNAWSAAAPLHPVLADGQVIYRDGGRTPVQRFRAAIARSAIEICGSRRSDLRICPAPACGMFYLRAHARQQWCSPVCGNRARVARHAAKAG